MSEAAALLERLLAAGTPVALVAEVAQALGEAEAERKASARNRALNAARQQARRDREKAAKEVAEAPVTHSHVTSRDVTDGNETSPDEAPSPNKAPHTPKINPTPCAVTCACEGECADAHEAPIPGHRLPDAVKAMLQAYLAAINAHRAKALAALWNGTPPPAGVRDEVWSGFLAHRKALPKAGKFTPRAYQLLCEKLAKLGRQGHNPNDLLDEAVDRLWVTVFPPDGGPRPAKAPSANKVTPPTPQEAAAEDAARAAVLALKAEESPGMRPFRIAIRNAIGVASYDGWIRATAFAWRDGTLVCTAPTKFKADWIDQHFADAITAAAKANGAKEVVLRCEAVRVKAAKTAGREAVTA